MEKRLNKKVEDYILEFNNNTNELSVNTDIVGYTLVNIPDHTNETDFMTTGPGDYLGFSQLSGIISIINTLPTNGSVTINKRDGSNNTYNLISDGSKVTSIIFIQ